MCDRISTGVLDARDRFDIDLLSSKLKSSYSCLQEVASGRLSGFKERSSGLKQKRRV